VKSRAQSKNVQLVRSWSLMLVMMNVVDANKKNPDQFVDTKELNINQEAAGKMELVHNVHVIITRELSATTSVINVMPSQHVISKHKNLNTTNHNAALFASTSQHQFQAAIQLPLLSNSALKMVVLLRKKSS